MSPPPYAPTAAPPTHRTATVSLVFGILSVVCLGGVFAGIPAVVLGRRALREIDSARGARGGRGVARAGIATGVVGCVVVGLPMLVAVGVLSLGPLFWGS